MSLKPYQDRLVAGLGLYSLSEDKREPLRVDEETIFITARFPDPKSLVLFHEMKQAYQLSNTALVVLSLNEVREQEERGARGSTRAA